MPDTTAKTIWDIWIRLFHWIFAASILFLLISGTTGFGFFDWHRSIGELVFMLIVFRLIWGTVGSDNARLTALFQHPGKAIAHLRSLFKRDIKQERRHNAAGGFAVIAILLLCLTQAVTGFFIADEDELIEGLLYGTVGAELSDLMYRIHHINAELIQIVVALHILMILIYLLYARINLIAPMITGKAQVPDDESSKNEFTDQHFSPWWHGAIVAIVVLAALGLWMNWFA